MCNWGNWIEIVFIESDEKMKSKGSRGITSFGLRERIDRERERMSKQQGASAGSMMRELKKEKEEQERVRRRRVEFSHFFSTLSHSLFSLSFNFFYVFDFHSPWFSTIRVHLQSDSLMLSLKIVYHFFKTILSYFVPVCAAISFFKSPTVSSGLHFTRT